MTATSDRYRKVADAFGERVSAVPDGAWDAPAPCEGWVARDIVRHLVEWVPAYLHGTWDLEQPTIPSVDDDPVAAWRALDAALQASLDDPAIAGAERDTPQGPSTFESTLDMVCTGDVLIHTWDLARATGLDEALDPDEVHAMLAEIAPMADALVASGHFDPPVPVPDDADEQTRLLAFLGRRP